MNDDIRALARRSGRRDLLVAVAAIAVAALLIGPGLSGAPETISTSQFVGSLAVAVVAALGLNLLSGYAGLVSLGQGGFVGIGAYASAWGGLALGLPWPLAIAFAVVVAAGLGTVLALAVGRLAGPAVAMITLAFAIVVHRVLNDAETFGRLSGYPNSSMHGTTLLEPSKLGDVALEPPLFAGTAPFALVPVGVLAVLAFLVYRNLALSAWGRGLKAIRQSELVASHIGIDPRRRKTAVFTIAAAFGGLAGTLQTQLTAHLQPESFTYTLSLTLIIMLILGGSGRLLGPVVGVVVLLYFEDSAMLEKLVDAQKELLGGEWYLSEVGVTGVILIVVLAVLPSGLVGGVRQIFRRFPRLAGLERRLRGGAAAGRAPARGAGPASLLRDQPRDGMGEVVLSMEHVTHAFAGNRAVDDMSLQLRRGQIHALVGPNGAGKTTFVNLITGVYTLQEGASASVLGVDITGLQPHRIQRLGVARTFQTPQLFGDETALENVLSGFDARLDEPFLATVLRTGRVRRAEAEGHAKSEALLHQLGLGEHADSLAADLPYGLQRSLELARALGCDPEVLILDEPAAGLNPAETYALGTLLQQIAATGVAILLVEHDMSLVVRVADVVTCMERGGLIYSGDAAGLQHDERVLTAYLGPGHVAIDSGRSNEEVRGAHS